MKPCPRIRKMVGWCGVVVPFLVIGLVFSVAVAFTTEVLFPPEVMNDPPWYATSERKWTWAPIWDASAARPENGTERMPDVPESLWNRTPWWDTVCVVWPSDRPAQFGTASEQTASSSPTGKRYVVVTRVGVPCRCFADWAVDPACASSATPNLSSYGRWQISASGRQSRFLSLMPLWPGLALNTLFYAAFGGAIWWSLHAVRRRLRVLRGRCSSCAYDRVGLAEGAVCPECGRAVI